MTMVMAELVAMVGSRTKASGFKAFRMAIFI
jgi:hypothetical protein